MEPTVTAESSAPLSGLAFDVDDVALIRPALRFELAIASAQGPEVLDFYQKSRAALGDRLQFVGTGSGTWKKITAKTDPMVETWCNSPVPYPKKTYFCAMQGADKGVTAASLHIDFVARPPHEPTAALLAKWRDPEFHPNLRYSNLSVSFPPEQATDAPERFVEWLISLAALRGPFISGTAGYGIDLTVNPPTSAAGMAASARAAALLLRYPGLDMASRWLSIGTSLLRRDLEYIDFMQAAVPRPYLKRVNWLTLLSAGQVAFLGGKQALRQQLPDHPSIRFIDLPYGLLIQAGPAPQLGDVTGNHYPIEYSAVARAIRKVRLPEIHPSSLGDTFDDAGAASWLNAFDDHP
jgi:hypothetical protein